MRIAEVIGTVTLSRWHPSLAGARFKLVVPLSLAELTGQPGEPAEEIAVFDELGAGVGNRIAVSEGREAAQPFYPDLKPIDAYNAAILDTVSIEPWEQERHQT
jgi:ethanolamine utilization protein EutN